MVLICELVRAKYKSVLWKPYCNQVVETLYKISRQSNKLVETLYKVGGRVKKPNLVVFSSDSTDYCNSHGKI